MTRRSTRCGVTILAGKAVGAPFVGSVAACVALSEALRLLQGGLLHRVIYPNLESVEHRSMVEAEAAAFGPLNPGFALAAG